MSIMGNLAKQICFVYYADKEYDREGWEKKRYVVHRWKATEKIKSPLLD